MPCADIDLLKHLYERFNARDMDAVVAMLHFDVLWANGMEGGHVSGHRGVRDYWTRQWAMIDPHVEPVSFSRLADEGVVVEVHQTVRDLSGNILSDGIVRHVFRVEHGLIRRFDIG